MTKKSSLKAVIVALCVALSVGYLPGCAGTANTFQPEQEAAQVETPAQTGKLSLAVSVEGWESSNQGVPISVSGTSSEGEKVERLVTVVPGQSKELDLAAGSYDFSVDGAKISTSSVAYQSTTAHTYFGGSRDMAVSLEVAQDAEATQELARKAEEEAAAKAQAEAEAAAAAQAEAQRQAEAAAAQSNEQTVYITNTGSKYHRNGCRHLKKSQIPISLSKAQAQGYTACKNCF